MDNDEPDLTIENATVIYRLADYLKVVQKFSGFWEADVKIEDLETCLDHATAFCIDALRNIVVKKCADRVVDISRFALNQRFRCIVLARDGSEELKSGGGSHPNLVSLIAEFCIPHKHHLDADSFSKLSASFKNRTL